MRKFPLFVACLLPLGASAQSLDGIWTNATTTPFERPASVKGREFYSPEEQAANAAKAQQPVDIKTLAGTDIHYDFTQYGLDPSQVKQHIGARTSIVVDPPDGKLPPMNAAGKARAAARTDARKQVGQFDGPETRPLGERCIVWPGEGPPMLPEAYNSNIQIHGGPGYVAIMQEMIHDVRIVPLDGSPHPGPKIRQYMGDSRGRWEGKTLVVDTTNFNGRTAFRGASENLHVIERFTGLDENSIRYEFTIEDAATWDRPWKGELIMTKTEGPIFEYACHEGNYGMPNTLRGAREAEKASEKEAAAK
jgi:hypothetical protein